ncbi:MAG: IS3 family transposase [Planctomycetota bacterium]
MPDKDKLVIKDLLILHVKHPRYGYRRITIKLREKDWLINFKRVYRLWRQEGLKIHRKQRKKLYTGGSENACHRRRPEYYSHIWSYDLLSERLENGRLVKLLVVIDEFTRECLAIDVNRKIKGDCSIFTESLLSCFSVFTASAPM